MSEHEIQQLLSTAGSLEEGPTKVSVVEQAVRMADSLQLDAIGFTARKDLISAAIFCGMPERAMPAFSWCLQRCDDQPQQFDEVEMLWEFKWILGNLKSFAHVSLQSILGLEFDFERRLLKNGFSLRPLHALRMERFYWPFEQDAKQEAYQLWMKAKRDRMANCFVCEENSKVDYWLECQQYEEAVKHGLYILDQGWQCRTMPHRLISSLLMPLLRLGRTKEAAKWQEKGYRMIRENRSLLLNIGQHLRYFAHTQQFTKGFNILKRHFHWAWESFCDENKWHFYSGAALFLETGGKVARKIDLPEAHPCYSPSGLCQCDELAAWLRTESMRLAAAFDTRNGNSYHVQKLESEREELGKLFPQ